LQKIKDLYQSVYWLAFAFLTALFLLSGCGGNDLQFSTEYQAVFLDNGQVFFGKISDTGSSFLTLRDVFYVQTLVEQEKKKTANLLIKRGSEWHNPDSMRINVRHILVIEPVGPDSRVAQLIREAKKSPVPQIAPPPKSEPPPGATPQSPNPSKTKKRRVPRRERR
jgi:hypothetical protein